MGSSPTFPKRPAAIYNLRNIPDTDKIKKYVDTQKPESAVIVGGGFIGLEMVENLVQRGVRTTIVEMADQVMLPLDAEMAEIVRVHLESKGVVCKLGKGVKGFRKDGDRLVVSVENDQDIECDMVILSIGIRPENRLANAAGLEIGKTSGIKVDASMQTSDPDIYAVGQRAYVGCRILRQHGFRAKNLSGGYETYKVFHS